MVKYKLAMNFFWKPLIIIVGIGFGLLFGAVVFSYQLVLLILVGLSIGSFLNVVAFRYEETSGFLAVNAVKGRSQCRSCLKPLAWYELIPVISFVIQKARCRKCLEKLSWQYPIIEIVTALSFVFVWESMSGAKFIIWLLAACVLIVIAAIDARTRIIPDEANLAIFFLGLARLFTGYLGPHDSFFKYNAYWFQVSTPLWLNQIVGLLVGLAIFGLIILVTRGRAMGMGDVKLAAAAGFLLGWPDILIATMLAFIIGGVASLILIARQKKGLKDMIPFGPYIVAGLFLVMFFGERIMAGYLNFFEWLLKLV